jgi:hypothetical protein
MANLHISTVVSIWCNNKNKKHLWKVRSYKNVFTLGSNISHFKELEKCKHFFCVRKTKLCHKENKSSKSPVDCNNYISRHISSICRIGILENYLITSQNTQDKFNEDEYLNYIYNSWVLSLLLSDHMPMDRTYATHTVTRLNVLWMLNDTL